MSVSIGLVANVFEEVNALPGWLETHLPFFDDVRVLHAGPDGEYSVDGTIELLEKWRVPVEFCAIDEGFGKVRTRAIRMSPCDYVMVLDADERFYPFVRAMSCEGESTPQSEVDAILQTYDFRDVRTVLPNWENVARLGAKLQVGIPIAFDQGTWLRGLLESKVLDAVVSVRRHWHDFSFRRPTQNWFSDPDWQMRIVKNTPTVYFDPEVRMHERLVGAVKTHHADLMRGPFFDHFHFTFKKMEVEQRAHDIVIYDSIHAGRKPPTWREYRGGYTV